MATKIYGSGDQMIVVEGENPLPTEFSAEEDIQYLVLSNGLVLKFEFVDAVWEIQPMNAEEVGTDFTITPASNREDIESDLFETDETLDWVMFGSKFIRNSE
jgi:hypothetical protein